MPRFWEGRGPGGTLFSPSQHASRTTAQGQNLSPQVARQSPTMFVLIMNGSHIEIDAHRLNDGVLLLSCSGNSYTTYMKEEVDRCVARDTRASSLPLWGLCAGSGSQSRHLLQDLLGLLGGSSRGWNPRLQVGIHGRSLGIPFLAMWTDSGLPAPQPVRCTLSPSGSGSELQCPHPLEQGWGKMRLSS